VRHARFGKRRRKLRPLSCRVPHGHLPRLPRRHQLRHLLEWQQRPGGGGALHGASAAGGVCFICLDDDPQPIRSGCACRSGGLAHLDCLIKKAVVQQAHRGGASWLTCQTCTQDFSGAMLTGLAEAWWSRVCDRPRECSERLYVALLLADCRGRDGHRAQALEMNQQVYADAREVYGEEHANTLRSAQHLAQKFASAGHIEQAERIGRDVLRARRQLFGDANLATQESARDLARFLSLAGQPEEAEDILRGVRDSFLATLGAEHPSTLHCTSRLAAVLSQNGNSATAERMLRAVLHVQARVLGAEHPETLTSANNLVVVLARQGKHSEAEVIATRNVRASRHVCGPNHPRTRAYIENLQRLQE
jgi:hypothetical protein